MDPETKSKIAKKLQEISEQGITRAEFCRRHNIDYQAFCFVVQGRSKGTTGASHDVHVALGLKKGVRTNQAERMAA
jgi:gp16 family phage-associated protein